MPTTQSRLLAPPFLLSSIGWHAGNLHWTGGVGVNVPVGDYREGALANIAFHRWAADLFGAATAPEALN
jgi:hypothetical protein